MTNAWSDFNDSEPQTSFDVIPKGTVAPVRMTIKPGGHDNPEQGWTGGLATRNNESGAVYLNCEFTITGGPFAKRKVFTLIGLHSEKGPAWGQMGRSFVRGILNSSRGVSEKDQSPQAVAARRINGLGDLDGIEFIAKIDVEKDARNGDDRNVIKLAITPDSKEYAGAAALANGSPVGATVTQFRAPPAQQPTNPFPGGFQPAASQRPAAAVGGLPDWAN